MFTKDKDINITILFCLKMMSCKNGKFQYSLFILLTQWHELSALKFSNVHLLIIPLPLNVALFSKSPYLTAHFKINYETGCIGRFSEKTQRYIQDHYDS